MIGKIVLLRRYAEQCVNLFGIFFVIKIMRKYKMQTVVLGSLLDTDYGKIQSDETRKQEKQVF